jgi:hypothetical protein
MTTRHFSGRDVGPFAEPILEDMLSVGRVYFTVSYADTHALEPEMQAHVFLGRDLFEDAPGFYFQDAASYRAGVSYLDGAVELSCQQSGHVRVMEFERALDCLLYCSILRNEGSSPA